MTHETGGSDSQGVPERLAGIRDENGRIDMDKLVEATLGPKAERGVRPYQGLDWHVRPGALQMFFLYRWDDVSGVSGTGVVAEGVRFSNGKCCVTWRGAVPSVTVYDSVGDLARIHLHGGATGLFWMGAGLNPELIVLQLGVPSREAYNLGKSWQ